MTNNYTCTCMKPLLDLELPNFETDNVAIIMGTFGGEREPNAEELDIHLFSHRNINTL